jgi:hypothetical protein
MASLPKIRRLVVEDFPDQKDWIGKLLLPLNEFMESVNQALDKNLALEENVSAQIKELSFQTRSTVSATFPLYFKLTLTRKPIGVLVVRAIEDDAAPATLTTAVWAYWELTQDGQIKISNLSGLSASQKYKVTFVVI